MRPDGKLERFDELQNVPYRDVEAIGVRRDMPANIYSFRVYIEEGLRSFQGYYVPHPQDAWTGYFPYAWYLREGMKVENTTIGDIYEIKEVQRGKNNKPTGIVVMSGNNAPERRHRLRFRREDAIVFMPAWPKTFAKTYQFKGSNLLADEKAGPWRDTITCDLSRKEPAGMGGKPFEGTRSVRPVHRATETYDPDPGYSVIYSGQWFDAIVQFDCWSKTNDNAERLVDWFEAFMEIYRGVFIWNGIQQLIYWQRTADELVTRWRDDIVNRTVQYYVRVENVAAELQRKVNSIIATIGLMPTGTVPTLEERYGPEWVAPTGIGDTIPFEVLETRYDGG